MNDFTNIELSDGRYYEVPVEVATEIERFKAAFRGVASCSTCEVCRNVAIKVITDREKGVNHE